jgi:MtrB/PioB family decaheme-associated outer membrane protein
MRIRTSLLLVVCGLAPLTALAQVPTAPAPAGPAAPAQSGAAVEEDALPTTYGELDFGVRSTSLKGDGARLERYRDLGDGVFLEKARYSSQASGWTFDLGVDHLGRRDQRVSGAAVLPGRLKVWGLWDQIPMLMSRTTRTLFTSTAPNVLEIDNAIQTAVQASAANLNAQLVNLRQFDLSSKRHIGEGGVQFIGHGGLTLGTTVRRTERDGAIPFGGSFGHGNVVETIAPVVHRLTDLDSNAEFQKGNVLVRGGYTGSWFHNEYTSLTFDNPWRVSDATTASSRGRMALSPSNSFVGVNGLVSYKLPYKSRVNVSASLGSLRDSGEALLPFTVNTLLVSPALDRAKTEGHAETSSMNLVFTSRPTRSVDIDVRYRTYEYNNKTPVFRTLTRVGYDNAVSAVTNVALQHSEPFGLLRHTFDADFRLSPMSAFSTGVGYGRTREERPAGPRIAGTDHFEAYRLFEHTTDNVFRLSVDSVGNRWFTLRTKYEHAEKRGEGDAVEIAAELSAIGEQPGMRHFDIASRDRNRVTITAATNPVSILTISGSFATGKDDYLESLFGLRDNEHRVYSLGFDVAPSQYYAAGLSYSFEDYQSLSRSRQASPLPSPQFTDASRNWATDTDDRAHSVIAYAEMLDFKQKWDVKLMVDYNRSRGLYRYITGSVPNRTLPEETVIATTLPDPTQLPLVRNRLGRSNLDVVYKISDRWGVGLSAWYERYRVSDFSLDSDALSRLDPAGALVLGYQYLPYTATTYWGRAIYRF